MSKSLHVPFNANFSFDAVRGVAILNWEMPVKNVGLLLKLLGNVSFTSRDVLTVLQEQLRDLGTPKETADLIRQLLSKYGSLAHIKF
jgi:hypothetical protein